MLHMCVKHKLQSVSNFFKYVYLKQLVLPSSEHPCMLYHFQHEGYDFSSVAC